MDAAGLFLLFLVFAVGGTLLLYGLIDAETDDLPTMNRADAERLARKDTDDGERDPPSERR
ncbi:hypothetical protein [Halegenticoccus tardaugens]|uniref:hypothetical protein n=1 Tax=Halegenticoccus tardaugens TaxID=2071624 RepID=UPI00100A793D|nr:hypothetical protein [Halegenticoccus tardaugens]